MHLDFFGREEAIQSGMINEQRDFEGKGMKRKMVIKRFETTIAKTDTYQNLSADIFSTDEGLNGDYSLEFEFDLDDYIPSTYHMKQEVVTIEEEKK